MKNLAKIRDEHEGAFTLVELLVVILIIGILAAIAIPAFLNQRKAAVDSSVESDVKNASTQVETWAVSHANEDVRGMVITTTAAGVTEVKSSNPAAPALTSAQIGAIADVKLGEGTTLYVTGVIGQAGQYSISGVNADGSRATIEGSNDGINFDSRAGGMVEVDATGKIAALKTP